MSAHPIAIEEGLGILAHFIARRVTRDTQTLPGAPLVSALESPTQGKKASPDRREGTSGLRERPETTDGEAGL